MNQMNRARLRFHGSLALISLCLKIWFFPKRFEAFDSLGNCLPSLRFKELRDFLHLPERAAPTKPDSAFSPVR